MEAALIASQRGHKVKLFEVASGLGGQLGIGSKPPDKEDLADFSRYLEHQVVKFGVEIKMNVKATLSLIMAEKPDVVVIASGVAPFEPKIPGLENIKTLNYHQVLSGFETGEKVVVIGGGLIGCEVALYLREQGKEIILLEVLDELAKDAFIRMKKMVTGKVHRSGIKVFTAVKS
jgi:NADPH-dependent 2,4-dienoyl-CoA reductase/sulfur reductase-like enzyme